MQEIIYTITRKKRKTAMIKVEPSGNVVISVPLSWSASDINMLINKKKSWITNTVQSVLSKVNKQPTIPANHIYYRGALYKFIRKAGLAKEYIIDDSKQTITASIDLLKSSEQQKFYRAQAKFLIPAMVYKLAKELNLNVKNVRVGHAKKLYGSYSLNNIMITERLILAPQSVINSVIYHELAHITHANHSKSFYNLLYKYCPKYDIHNKWLQNNGYFISTLFYD